MSCNNLALPQHMLPHTLVVSRASMRSIFDGLPKFARALVAIALLLSQVHFGPPEYVTDQGAPCTACATISNLEECSQISSEPHGDCHDCCSIRACDEQASYKFATNSNTHQWDVPAALLDQYFVNIERQILFVQKQIEFDPGAPSTGPPRLTPSRAPPVI